MRLNGSFKWPAGVTICSCAYRFVYQFIKEYCVGITVLLKLNQSNNQTCMHTVLDFPRDSF